MTLKSKVRDCRCLPPRLLRDTLSSRIVGKDRLLWNSIVQGTQKFRQVRAPSCIIPYDLEVVCIALGVDVVWRGSLPALIYPGGQGYMESLSRVQLESYYNTIG